jgi:hypothetical protein
MLGLHRGTTVICDQLRQRGLSVPLQMTSPVEGMETAIH